MSCCKDEKSKRMGGISGELKIWNIDGSLKTISLGEEDMWALLASVNNTDHHARNEPGFANGNGKAAVTNLLQKLTAAYSMEKQENTCTNKSCGCKQEGAL